MVKKLFRVEFTDPKNRHDEEFIERSQSFRVSDQALSKHIDVHVLKLPMSYAREKKVGMYGRDRITEWGNLLVINPGLCDNRFGGMMDDLGYKGPGYSDELLSEGGLYVMGKEFILISDNLEQNNDFFKEIMDKSGLNIPFYFLPSLTSTSGGHIDCDYQVIDSLRILYAGHNAMTGDTDKDKKIRKRLEDIASKHNYELRLYRHEEVTPSHGLKIADFLGTLAKRTNGINFITNGVVLTGAIHPEEKEYLSQKGMETAVIPLGNVSPGAGLRCVYGEFNL